MRVISGIFLFLVVFFAVGVAIHFAIYSKPGVFVWSVQSDGDGGSGVARTSLEVAPVEVAEEEQVSSAAMSESEPGDSVQEDSGSESEQPAAAADPNTISLFNGKDLGDWKKTQFGGEGDVFVNEENNLEVGFGAVMTGVHWGGEVPRTSNYEISLDAMKLDGNDFFCALTFPVKESHATFIVGGWGGGIVGISSVDDLDASENETMNIEGFATDTWYKIKVRVTDDKLQAWIDDREMVDLDLEDRKISLRPGDVELCVPLGLASYITRAQYRNIVWRNLEKEE